MYVCVCVYVCVSVCMYVCVSACRTSVPRPVDGPWRAERGPSSTLTAVLALSPPWSVSTEVTLYVVGISYKPPEYKEHDFSEAPKVTASLNDRAATGGYTTKLLCAVRGTPMVGPGTHTHTLTHTLSHTLTHTHRH